MDKLRRDVSSHYPQTDGAIGSTRFDILKVPRLFEFSCPMSHDIFSTSTRVFLPACENHLFDESTDFTINPISPIVLIIAKAHADKTFMNPGAGTWAKERDALPAWLTACISDFDTIEDNADSTFMINWNDGNN